jgi:hypothetical protein
MQTVTDTAQAKALTNHKLIGFLQYFIGQERSVSEAAAHWQVKVETAYYRVKQLERLDLKRYRAVSDNFFVPLGIIPEATLEEFLETTHQHFKQLLSHAQAREIRAHFSQERTGRWGIHIGLNALGQQSVHLSNPDGDLPDLLDPEMPMIAHAWPQLRLDYEDAQAIRNEIFELFKRFDNRLGARKYLFHFALAPLEEGD